MKFVYALIFSCILCLNFASASDLSDLGKALIKKDTFYLPDGDLGKLGKAIIKGPAKRTSSPRLDRVSNYCQIIA